MKATTVDPSFGTDRNNRGILNTEEVYIIVRVFNLDKGNIDMRLYVDPAAMEAAGQLSFTAQQWSVVPGRGIADTVVS